jgi:hypothetical protein
VLDEWVLRLPSVAYAAGKLSLAWAGQFGCDAAPAGDGHQQRLGRPSRFRSGPGREFEVGGD